MSVIFDYYMTTDTWPNQTFNFEVKMEKEIYIAM